MHGVLASLYQNLLFLQAIPLSFGYDGCAIEPVMVATTHWTHLYIMESALSTSLRSQLEYYTLH